VQRGLRGKVSFGEPDRTSWVTGRSFGKGRRTARETLRSGGRLARVKRTSVRESHTQEEGSPSTAGRPNVEGPCDSYSQGPSPMFGAHCFAPVTTFRWTPRGDVTEIRSRFVHTPVHPCGEPCGRPVTWARRNSCRAGGARRSTAGSEVEAGFGGVMQTFDNTRPLVAGMAVGCARAALW